MAEVDGRNDRSTSREIVRTPRGVLRILEQTGNIGGTTRVAIETEATNMSFVIEEGNSLYGKIYHDVLPLDVTLRFVGDAWKDMHLFYTARDDDLKRDIPLGFYFTSDKIEAFFHSGRQKDLERYARLAHQTHGSRILYNLYGVSAERRNGVCDIIADGKRYHIAPTAAEEEAAQLRALLNGDIRSHAQDIIDMAERFRRCVSLPEIPWRYVDHGTVLPSAISQEHLNQVYRIEHQGDDIVLKQEDSDTAVCRVSLQDGTLKFIGRHNELYKTNISAMYIDGMLKETMLFTALQLSSGAVFVGFSVGADGMVSPYLERIDETDSERTDDSQDELPPKKRGAFIVKERTTISSQHPEIEFIEQADGEYALSQKEHKRAILSIRVVEGVIQAYAEGEGWCDILPRGTLDDARIISSYLKKEGNVQQPKATQALSWMYRMLCKKGNPSL